MRKVGTLVFIAAVMSAAIATAAGGATKAQLQSKALSISNFPTDWAADNSSNSGATDSSCLKTLHSTFKHEVKVTADYRDGDLPALQETIETGPGVSSRYAKFTRVLTACKSISYTAGGQQVTGTIGAMTFPQVGTRSSTFAATLKVEEITVRADIVLFQVGKVIGDVVYEDYLPEPEQVKAFVTEAIRKIEGKPTVTPTPF